MSKIKDNGYIVVYITASNEEEGLKIGKGLVENSLSACANILNPIRSIYRWKGRLYDEKEVLVILKSRRELFDKIKEYVKGNHSYEVPEIISIPISDGLPEYLAWIDENTIIKQGSEVKNDRKTG